MTPPKAPAGICPDSSSVSLQPFSILPKVQDIPDAARQDPNIQGLYASAAAFNKIDQEYGNKDGNLDAGEVDKFLAAKPIQDPTGKNITSCDLLKQARMMADLSEIDLATIYALPDLKKFIALPEFGDMTQLAKSLNTSDISPELKNLLLNDPRALTLYITARNYSRLDIDKNGKLSISDVNYYLQMNKMNGNDPRMNPLFILGQARDFVPQMSVMGLQLRKALNLKSDPNAISVPWLISLYEKAPAFVEGEPRLNALLQVIAKKDPATNQFSINPEAMDMEISRDEFKKYPKLAELKAQLKVDSDDALFTMIKDLEDQMSSPVYLWPADLKDKLQSSGKQAYQAIGQSSIVNADQAHAELALNFLEMTSWGKKEQEKIDHDGPGGKFLGIFVKAGTWIGEQVGITKKSFTYNEYWQNIRPDDHKAERDGAIEALKRTLRDRHLDKIEDAVAYMEKNGDGDRVKVLKDQCDLDRWLKIANIDDDYQRAKEIRSAAVDYRRGDYKFWEFPIIPMPRLGSGGFLERASKWDNWTIKSPELPVTLSLDNFLAVNTPNNWNLLNKQGTIEESIARSIIFTQMSDEDRKAFDAIVAKAPLGTLQDTKEGETLLAKTSLTPKSQEILKNYLTALVSLSKNSAVIKKVMDMDFVKELMKDKEKNKDKLQKIDLVFSTVAGGAQKADKVESELDSIGLSSSDADALKKALKEIVPQKDLQEGPGIDTLFREAQLGDKEARARELFNKSTQTDAEKAEFKEMINKSKLSEDNKSLLIVSYDQQPPSLEIAMPAQDEALAIMGFPKIDPMTGKYDPKSVGSLHNSMRTTVDKGVGLAMLLGPTAAGAGIGVTLSKVKDPRWALGGGIVVGGGVGYLVSDHQDSKTTLKNMLLGAGIGGGSAWALNRLTKGNPFLGGTIMGLAGTAFTISPLGVDWRNKSFEIMATPYRPWSDFSVANTMTEGIGLYMDWYAGCKMMDGVIGGLRFLGSLELGTRLAAALKIPPMAISGGLKKAGDYAKEKVFGKTPQMLVTETAEAAKAGGKEIPFTSPWAEQQHAKILEQMAPKEAFLGEEKVTALKELLQSTDPEKFAEGYAKLTPAEQTYVNMSQMARAYEKLGKANSYSFFSGRVLLQAQKLLKEGEALIAEGGDAVAKGEAMQAKANWLIQAGAQELDNLAKMAMANKTMNKLLLAGMGADKMDSKLKPNGPGGADSKDSLVPPIKTNFNGNPRPVPKKPTQGQNPKP
ncbi:MAG: hypothetical protein U1F57_01095 [bacterium]